MHQCAFAQWVPATLLVYGGPGQVPLVGGTPSGAAFGVLWQDHGMCL